MQGDRRLPGEIHRLRVVIAGIEGVSLRESERAMVVPEGFDVWWAKYPRRIGKLAAMKAYAKVRKGGTTQDVLMDGIDQYIATKPAWQEFAHPTTWLNQGRWMDEAPELPRSAISIRTCPHVPLCRSFTACRDLILAEGRRREA